MLALGKCYNAAVSALFSRWFGRRGRPDPLPPALRRQLEATPHASMRVIARVAGDVEARRTAVEDLGLRVHRVFTLTPGLAVEGPSSAILKLADYPWVISIEADRTVHTMPEESGE